MVMYMRELERAREREIVYAYMNVCVYICVYRVAKTHRMPYLYWSFSVKEPYT